MLHEPLCKFCSLSCGGLLPLFLKCAFVSGCSQGTAHIKHTHIHTHTHTYTHTYAYIYIRTHTHIHTHLHAHTYPHIYICTHTHTYTHTHTHTCTHTYTHKTTYIRTNTQTYTHSHARPHTQAVIGNYAVPILEDKSVWGTNDETRTAYLDSQDVARMALAALRSVKALSIKVS